jgi:hypothetical protein
MACSAPDRTLAIFGGMDYSRANSRIISRVFSRAASQQIRLQETPQNLKFQKNIFQGKV